MLEHFGIKDFIDVLLVALLLYYLFQLVKISGMRPLFAGIIVFVIIWVVVSQVFNMVLLGSILDQFVNIGLILLAILFQDEIRRFLMSLGSQKGWKFFAKLLFPNSEQEKDMSHITPIILACMNMSRSKTGALIVIQGELYLGLYEQTGEIINADISSRLIENIFFKNSHHPVVGTDRTGASGVSICVTGPERVLCTRNGWVGASRECRVHRRGVGFPVSL